MLNIDNMFAFQPIYIAPQVMHSLCLDKYPAASVKQQNIFEAQRQRPALPVLWPQNWSGIFLNAKFKGVYLGG